MRTQALALALLVTVVPAVPAGAKTSAAPKPQIVDMPPGDQRAFGPAYDLRTALFSTAGRSVRSGKKTTYVPDRLVVTVTYSAPPAKDAYASQVVAFATDTCQVYLEIYGVNRRTYGAASCIPDAFAVPASVSGNVLTVTLPFGYLGAQHLRPGVVLRELETWTNVAEPSAGYESGDVLGSAFTVDVGSSDVTYTIR